MPTFTKEFIENEIESVHSGQRIYRDDILRALALRVTRRSKTFVVEKRVEGKNCRFVIGKYGDISVEQARERAKLILTDIAHKSPKVPGSVQHIPPTVRQSYKSYLATHNLSPKTKLAYQYHIEKLLPEWLDLPITSITPDMVESKHAELLSMPTRLGTHGRARADEVFISLGAILKLGSEKYSNCGDPILKFNPVRRLTLNRAWHKKESRHNIIQDDNLSKFYVAISTVRGDVIRDYLLFLTFTGMRQCEVKKLEWSMIDFARQSVTVPARICKFKREYTIPLSSFLIELLQQRYSKRVNSNWVFQSERNPSRPLSEFTVTLPRIRNKCGVHFHFTDLRRTFLAMGAKLGVHLVVLTALTDQKPRDITLRYTIPDTEHMRTATDLISQEFVKLMGIKLGDMIEHKRKEKSVTADGTQLLLDFG